MLSEIFSVVIIPLLGILTTYLVKFIQVKKQELELKIDTEQGKKYLNMLQDTVVDCVLTTTQTYVEALKKDNAFTLDAQQKAFEMTRDAVLAILSEDAKDYLKEALGDFDTYLTTLIES
jgi:hypothetical protein